MGGEVDNKMLSENPLSQLCSLFSPRALRVVYTCPLASNSLRAPEIAVVKVTNRLLIAKSNGNLALILPDLSVIFDTNMKHSILESSSFPNFL